VQTECLQIFDADYAVWVVIDQLEGKLYKLLLTFQHELRIELLDETPVGDKFFLYI